MLFLKWNINRTIKSEVLTMHTITSLLYTYVKTHEKKAPINKLSRSKTQQVGSFTHITTDYFSRPLLGWYIGTRKNFAYLGSFAKVSVPVKSIIP